MDSTNPGMLFYPVNKQNVNTMGDVKHLFSAEAVKKLQDIAGDAKVCHFVTGLNRQPLSSRPMSTQQVDDEGNFWFLSNESSHKNMDIENEPEVQLFYANTSNYEYLTVFGFAEIVRDRQKLDEIWTPIAKTWFTEGKEDPELTIIKVNVADAYYWDTKNNKLVSLAKIVAGAVTGKTMDDGIEGKINV